MTDPHAHESEPTVPAAVRDRARRIFAFLRDIHAARLPIATTLDSYEQSVELGELQARREYRSGDEPTPLLEVRASRDRQSLFNRLFTLRAALERGAGRFELLLGNAHLQARTDQLGQVDHPVLLRAVTMEMDERGQCLRLYDIPGEVTVLHRRLLDALPSLAPALLDRVESLLVEDDVHPVDASAATIIAGVIGAVGTISAQPVLLLRERGQNLVSVLNEVVEQIGAGSPLPESLRLIAGDPSLVAQPELHRPGAPVLGRDLGLLLAKPGNPEQQALAAELDHSNSVRAWGPPGTGKSHTIANLIGHLAAQGKRVLVTSQTTKALTVLRDQLSPEIRSLAISVNRDEGIRALQGAVDALVEGLEQPRVEVATQVHRLTQERIGILHRLEQLKDDVQRAVGTEYTPIHTGYRTVTPREGAQLVAVTDANNAWIPGPLRLGMACPLTEAEVSRLHELARDLQEHVERGVRAGVLAEGALPALEEVTLLLGNATNSGDATLKQEGLPSAMTREQVGESLAASEAIIAILREVQADLNSLTELDRRLLALMIAPGASATLATDLDAWLHRWERVLDEQGALAARRHVEIDPSAHPFRVVEVVERELRSATARRAIAWWRRWFVQDVRWLLRVVRVNGVAPTTRESLDAVLRVLQGMGARTTAKEQWEQLVGEGLDLPVTLASCGPLRDAVVRSTPIGSAWRDILDRVASLLGASTRSTVNQGALERRLDAVESAIRTWQRAIRRQVAATRLAELVRQLERHAHPLVREAARSLRQRDGAAYAAVLSVTADHRRAAPLVQEWDDLLRRLAVAAPGWSEALRRRDIPRRTSEVRLAWELRQITQELTRRHDRESVSLHDELRSCRQSLLDTTAELVRARTWDHLLAPDRLPARAQALKSVAPLLRRVGKGTGVQAPQQIAQAKVHLQEAHAAVPIWIMPLDRVFELLHPAPQLFDVVILDEASQCDLTALLALYLGRTVLIVGDHNQVQPFRGMVSSDQVIEARRRWLGDFPQSALFDAGTSVYDLAQTAFARTVMLREHFRCVPDIIAYSNDIAYEGKIRALRSSAGIVAPPLVESLVRAEPHDREESVNRAEALQMTALVCAMAEHPSYGACTIGAVCLQHEDQVRLVQELLQRHLPGLAWARHRIAVGAPSHFQGDERDVVVMCLTAQPRGSRLPQLQDRTFLPRINVAVSRARDQLWLVHSLDPAVDLHPDDLRARLIRHVRDPIALRMKYEESGRPARAGFRPQVAAALQRLGYDVALGAHVGHFVVDIVVRGAGHSAVISCFGEEVLDRATLEQDLLREETLERVGWPVVRIPASRWLLDPQRETDRIVVWLHSRGVTPGARGTGQGATADADVAEVIRQRAVQLLGEWGYSPV